MARGAGDPGEDLHLIAQTSRPPVHYHPARVALAPNAGHNTRWLGLGPHKPYMHGPGSDTGGSNTGPDSSSCKSPETGCGTSPPAGEPVVQLSPEQLILMTSCELGDQGLGH